MKNKSSVLIFLLTVFAFNFLSAHLSYASEERVLSEIKDGYRILILDPDKDDQNFTVYRGDYIKFKLPESFNESIAVFPTLEEQKKVIYDLETTSYFKMKHPGVYPFKIDSFKGQIHVIDYQQIRYKEVSSKEAKAFIKTDNPFILDVRTPREYAKGHLENSVLLPVQMLQKRIKELDGHKNDPILIYCATGNRSTVASKILIDSGFVQIVNLRRGIADWAKNHYKVVR